MRADVVVVGLGGMGSAAAAALSRRGRRVVGLERHWPAHDRGSSHGQSRIIRQAYFEHPSYVPLLLEAYERWERLERDADADLLTETGGLVVGPPDSQAVAGALASAREHDLPHELLEAREVAARWPAMTPAEGEVALHEPRAGFVRPEATVSAHLRLAVAAGAELRFGTLVRSWRATESGVTVHTSAGAVEADRLVLCGGSWSGDLLTGLDVPLTVERQLQVWLTPRDGAAPFAPDRQPVWIWEDASGEQAYGFPALPGDAGVKAAFFRRGGPADPDTVDRAVQPGEVEALAAFLSGRIPALAAPAVRAAACLYTLTPDHHFAIGVHPGHPSVTVAAGFSGHGFKFVPVIGELLADLAIDGATARPIELFDLRRFARLR
ncbi:MAG TPA: N-methyl-L-tryptophan oxidase [Baekduia sp.]|nr:N-methyl-L-tryptophan oxidase [Baekduia sp.]